MNSGSFGSELSKDQYGTMVAGFSVTNIDVQPLRSLSEDWNVERKQLQEELEALQFEKEQLKMKLAQMRGEVQRTRQTVKKFRSMKDKTASGVSNVSFIGDQSHS